MKFKLNFLNVHNSSGAAKKRKNRPLSVFITAPLFVLALAYLLYIPSPKAITETGLKVGDIADEDIKIVQDITVEDKEETNRRIQGVVDNIVPVYEFNPDNRNETRNLFNQWFELTRQFRKKYIKNRNTLNSINQEIEKTFGIELPVSRLEYFLKSNIFGRIDVNRLLLFLEEINKNYIIASKIGAKKSNLGNIKITAKDREPRIINVDDLYDLRDVELLLERHLTEQKQKKSDRESILSILMDFMDVNISYSINLTQQEEKGVMAMVNPALVKLKAGKIVLRKGDEVKPEHLKIINLVTATEKTSHQKLSNYYLIVAIMIFLSYFTSKFFSLWKSDNINREKLFVVIGSTLVLSAVIYRVSLFLFPLILKNISIHVSYSIESTYFAIPFGFGALIIAFLFTLQSAFIFSFINSIIGGIMCSWDFKVMIYILLGNLAVGYGIEYFNRLKRSSIIKASIFWLFPVNLVMILLLNLTWGELNISLLVLNILLAGMAAVIAPVLATFVIPLWEVVFKLVTDLKLIELTNLNLPIFREMLEKAPGTYHHSQMVASLSEAAAADLEISPLRLRAMALYHDIGKIENPHLFTENHSIYKNPHDNYTPRESAKNIIGHIPDGLERAQKIKLPQTVVTAITQHHGTKLVRFFYDKARDMSSIDTDQFDDKPFRYQGEKPKTIESAIIMLADQVEAASKSLASPSDEELKNVIQGIITNNIEENQLDECDGLTLKSLNVIASSFHQKLSSIYHMRVSYPGFDFKDKNEGNKK